MKTVNVEGLIVASPFQNPKYRIIDSSSAIGILYLTNNFLSGNLRMRERLNGSYHFKYKEMIQNVFGTANNATEVCSNSSKVIAIAT